MFVIILGEISKCDFFMNQAQLDAENFINTELQKREDISQRFVSLRDYDMQYVEVISIVSNATAALINNISL